MSSRKRRQKNNNDLKGWILIASAALIISGIMFYFFELRKNHIEISPDSMCRLDGFVPRETAIIIDATDSFSETQAMMIKSYISQTLQDSLKDEKFSLYVLNEEINNTTSLIVACNPGDGSDKSELTSNLRRLKNKWENNFYSKFVKSISELVGNHSAKQSPIMEMIKYVSIEAMYPSTAKEKRIIIVSDMLHHTKEYSQYKNKLDINSFLKTPYAIEEKPQLKDVGFEVLYVIRGKNIKLQNRGHIGFWEAYISNAGGYINYVKTIN